MDVFGDEGGVNGGLAVAGEGVFAVAANAVFSHLSTPSLRVTDVSTVLPLQRVFQQGRVVVGVLSDPLWKQQPQPAHREELTAALTRLKPLGIQQLMLVGPDNAPVAVAMVSSGTVAVNFFDDVTKPPAK